MPDRPSYKGESVLGHERGGQSLSDGNGEIQEVGRESGQVRRGLEERYESKTKEERGVIYLQVTSSS